MKTPDREPLLGEPFAADEAPDALDRLLAEVRVAVDPEFSRQVMGRIAAAPPHRARSARREWALAAALAAVLLVVASVLVASGRSAEGGVADGVVGLLVATLAAGAGFVAASWRGIGQTVGAALDGSVTAMIALGLAALAANALLFMLLRRRRAAPARRSDES